MLYPYGESESVLVPREGETAVYPALPEVAVHDVTLANTHLTDGSFQNLPSLSVCLKPISSNYIHRPHHVHLRDGSHAPHLHVDLDEQRVARKVRPQRIVVILTPT